MGDGASLCATCTTHLQKDLDAIPDLAYQLEITATRQHRFTRGREGGRSSTTPLPWVEHASVVSRDLYTVVAYWCLETARLSQSSGDPLEAVGRTTAALARWLRRNVGTLRRHESADLAAHQIRDRVKKSMSAVDRPPDKMFAGKCGAVTEDGATCQEDLYGYPGKEYTHCRACAAKHNLVERREEMLTEVKEQSAHAGLIVGILRMFDVRIASSTIRAYASRQRIKVVSIDGQNRPLYRIGEVLDLFLKNAA